MGLKINNQYVGILAFADDLVLLAEGFEQAQTMMYNLENILTRYQLTLNIQKTKYISSHPGRLTYVG